MALVPDTNKQNTYIDQDTGNYTDDLGNPLNANQYNQQPNVESNGFISNIVNMANNIAGPKTDLGSVIDPVLSSINQAGQSTISPGALSPGPGTSPGQLPPVGSMQQLQQTGQAIKNAPEQLVKTANYPMLGSIALPSALSFVQPEIGIPWLMAAGATGGVGGLATQKALNGQSPTLFNQQNDKDYLQEAGKDALSVLLGKALSVGAGKIGEAVTEGKFAPTIGNIGGQSIDLAALKAGSKGAQDIPDLINQGILKNLRGFTDAEGNAAAQTMANPDIQARAGAGTLTPAEKTAMDITQYTTEPGSPQALRAGLAAQIQTALKAPQTELTPQTLLGLSKNPNWATRTMGPLMKKAAPDLGASAATEQTMNELGDILSQLKNIKPATSWLSENPNLIQYGGQAIAQPVESKMVPWMLSKAQGTTSAGQQSK